MNIASHIEHSCLKPTATLADIEQVCLEAVQYHFAAVCVPPMFVKKAKALTAGTLVRTATVIGFPYGYNAIEAKLAETVLAIVDGADELDIMINLVALKNKDWQYLAKEISTLLNVVRKSGKSIKVILEASMLNENEITTCCDMYGAAGVDFIQTSTGSAGSFVSLEILKMLRRQLADAVQLKSNDGIDPISAAEWIAAGAERIVCNDPLRKDGMIFENRSRDYN
ncbi:MAG: deoxyribose-phosphate aldolase [Ferruginibacter sp.]|nr:deoxyribose-phosphate aldolase [Ferruginibacter sp.]